MIPEATISRLATTGPGTATSQRLLVGVDDKMPAVYQSVLDPLLALTFAAAYTRRIRLGVALVNVPFISPVYLAKQAATLDVLSGGRLDLGLGVGWLATEFTAFGVDQARRGARIEEYIRVLHTLWDNATAEFYTVPPSRMAPRPVQPGGPPILLGVGWLATEFTAFGVDQARRGARIEEYIRVLHTLWDNEIAEFYTVPPSRMAPRPVQPGGPPILLGGVVPAGLRRAGRLAAGWMSRSTADLDRIAEDIAVVRADAPDPSAVRIAVRGVVRPGERSGRLSGSYDQIRADAEWLGEQGVTELYYDLNFDPYVELHVDDVQGLEPAAESAVWAGG